MLVVAGTITFDPAHQQRMIEAATAVAEATRAEDGCISYEFFADLNKPGRFSLFEQWEDEASLMKHFDTPHIATYYAVLETVGMKNREISRYEVSSVGPVR